MRRIDLDCHFRRHRGTQSASALVDPAPCCALPLARGTGLGQTPRSAGAGLSCSLAKLVSVTTPWLYKIRRRSFGRAMTPDAGLLLGLGAVGLVVAYGLARLGRSRLWANLGMRSLSGSANAQSAALAIETFTHIHQLSACAITSLARPAVCPGSSSAEVKGVDFLLRFMLFSIGPLILELSMVAGHLRAWSSAGNTCRSWFW